MALPESLLPFSPLRSARRWPLAQEPEIAEIEAVDAGRERVWPVILAVGGACWLVVTGTALLYMLPASGTNLGDTSFVSNAARGTQ